MGRRKRHAIEKLSVRGNITLKFPWIDNCSKVTNQDIMWMRFVVFLLGSNHPIYGWSWKGTSRLWWYKIIIIYELYYLLPFEDDSLHGLHSKISYLDVCFGPGDPYTKVKSGSFGKGRDSWKKPYHKKSKTLFRRQHEGEERPWTFCELHQVLRIIT